MSILDKIEQDFPTWKIDKKPELHPGGFFDEINEEIERQNELFIRVMSNIKQGYMKLYPSLPERLRPWFIRLYHKITNGKIPTELNVQDDDMKQSASIRIDLWLPTFCHHDFYDLMERQDKVLPFDCVFTAPDPNVEPRLGSEKWVATNTQFAFYLIRMLGVRI